MPAADLPRLKEISRSSKEALTAIGTEDIAFIQGCLTSIDDEIAAYAYWTIEQIGIVNPNAVVVFINQAFADLQSAPEKVHENALFAIGRTGRAKISADCNHLIERTMRNIEHCTPMLCVGVVYFRKIADTARRSVQERSSNSLLYSSTT